MKVILTSIAAILFFAACEKIIGEGPVIMEERNTTAFNGLAINIPADVDYKKSTEYHVTLEAQQNILDEIEAVVSDNILKIRFRHPNVRIKSHEKIFVHITGPDPRLLEVNGSGLLQVEGTIEPAETKLVMSGSGTIEAGEILSNKIEVVMSGSGRIEINTGNANEEKITISGSGFVGMAEVMVKDADTYISGSGNMEVYPTNSLKAKISGSGIVYYRGNPTTISSQVSGSGKVQKL